MTADTILLLAGEGAYVRRQASPITLALATVFFLGAALSMLSSKQRNQDFFYKPGDPGWSIRRGVDRARTVMSIGMGVWGIALVVNFVAPEPRGIGFTIALGLLGLVGFALLLVAGSVVLFNWPKFAAPVKFREDQSPVGHFLGERGRA